MIDRLTLVSKDSIEKLQSINLKSETTDLDFKEIYNISDSKAKLEFV